MIRHVSNERKVTLVVAHHTHVGLKRKRDKVDDYVRKKIISDNVQAETRLLKSMVGIAGARFGYVLMHYRGRRTHVVSLVI